MLGRNTKDNGVECPVLCLQVPSPNGFTCVVPPRVSSTVGYPVAKDPFDLSLYSLGLPSPQEPLVGEVSGEDSEGGILVSWIDDRVRVPGRPF